MKPQNLICADALIASQQDICDLASDHLLETHPAMAQRFGDDARQHWRDHFSDRVAELSEAIAADEPQIFKSHVAWAQRAITSRSINVDYIGTTLVSLQVAIGKTLDTTSQEITFAFLSAATETMTETDDTLWETALDAGLPHDRLALHYIQMVIAGNVRAGMQVVLDALEEGFATEDLYLRVLLPAQSEVGRLWHLNEVSVAEEHLVTSTTQRLMAILADRTPHKADRGYTAIATAVAGNAHDIGIRTIAYLMEFEGWRTIFLGSDLPRSDLPSAVQYYDADVVLLSTALGTQLRTLKRSIREIREVCSPKTKIMVGGNGLSEVPDLWQKIGADGYTTDAKEALTLAAELVSKP